MLYRILRAVNRSYPFVMFWGYVGLFLLALPFVFIFPLIPLVLVMFGALSVAIVFALRKLLLMPQHWIAHHKLNKDSCPRCGETVIASTDQHEAAWHCVSCGTLYTERGAEIEAVVDTDPIADHEARLAL